MIRSLLLASAYLLLYSAPSYFPSPTPLPFSGVQQATILTILPWLLALSLILDINSLLNHWAENKWLWRVDNSAWDWKNEVAVVTGGSGGIGAVLVQKLVSYGIKVAVLDIQPLSDNLQNEELVHFYQCDIASQNAVRQAAKAIRSDHGFASILINNAGIGNGNTILELSPERLRAIFDVNILSHWNTVQEFLPSMIDRKKGHIMSTASLAAFVGLAGTVDYSCTKAGLIAFHEGLAQELKHRYNCPEIKTSIVYPNWTRTPLIEAIEQNLSSAKAPIVAPEYVAEAMAKHIINGRSGQLILGPTIAASIRALPIWLQEIVRDRMAQVVTVNTTTAR